MPKTKLTWAGKPVKMLKKFSYIEIQTNPKTKAYQFDIKFLLKNYPTKTELRNILKAME